MKPVEVEYRHDDEIVPCRMRGWLQVSTHHKRSLA